MGLSIIQLHPGFCCGSSGLRKDWTKRLNHRKRSGIDDPGVEARRRARRKQRRSLQGTTERSQRSEDLGCLGEVGKGSVEATRVKYGATEHCLVVYIQYNTHSTSHHFRDIEYGWV